MPDIHALSRATNMSYLNDIIIYWYRLSETRHKFPRQSEGEVYASPGHPFSLVKWVGEWR